MEELLIKINWSFKNAKVFFQLYVVSVLLELRLHVTKKV